MALKLQLIILLPQKKFIECLKKILRQNFSEDIKIILF